MKKHTFFTMLCVLLVLTGCQKRQEQTDIRLPESDSAVTEETITEPTEKAEEALPEESSAKPKQESVAPDLGTYKELLEVLQTLQTREDWKSSPEYEMITAQKEKVLSQLIRSFYHGQDSLSLRDTAWGDRDLPGMAFEVFRSLLGSEDLEREAETPLEWFRTWFIWAFGHIHEADAEGLQAQYPASYAAIRLWITTIHGKIPLQPIWTGSVSTTSISTQRETRLCPTSVKMKRSGRFRIR